MGFRDDFVWGAATASYQIEGAAFEDGKGLNIWDVFAHTPQKIYDGHNGDIACDHYHRLEEDLDAIQSLGIQSYRFSVSWSRLLPEGIGQLNEAGINFYNRMIDGLIDRGIEPCMTLYHWDLPYALHLQGGWLNDNSSDWFAEYATLIQQQFGDRVKCFITFNEAEIFTGLGYRNGTHAPGYQLGKSELLRICHNVLKAHGKAVLALRKGIDCKIGFTDASMPTMPATKTPHAIAAARTDFLNSNHDGFMFTNAFWLDPIFTGRYPDWVYEYKGINAPVITVEDMELIHQKIDFIGLNIYQGKYVDASGNALSFPVGMTRTSIGWPVTPEALYWSPYFIYERYQTPIMITENGMACHDTVSCDGKVHDENRIDFMHRYLRALKSAAEDGVDIRGYYAWSLMDNFEWAEGYKERFGIIYTNYQTQERILKDSASWYKKIIQNNGESL